MKFALFLFLGVLLTISASIAAPYTIDKANSKIEFTGKHAGKEFTGRFESWDASIDFDTEFPEKSIVTATFDTTTAKTGNAMYDGTLPQSDWFNSKQTPAIQFKSTGVSQNADGSYTMVGDLTIRGITKSIRFPFTLSADNPAVAIATIPLKRLDFDIGKKSDPAFEWVSETIVINLTITASKQP